MQQNSQWLKNLQPLFCSGDRHLGRSREAVSQQLSVGFAQKHNLYPQEMSSNDRFIGAKLAKLPCSPGQIP
jgi:hypothetical protein